MKKIITTNDSLEIGDRVAAAGDDLHDTRYSYTGTFIVIREVDKKKWLESNPEIAEYLRKYPNMVGRYFYEIELLVNQPPRGGRWD